MQTEWAIIVSGQPRGDIYSSHDDFKELVKYFDKVDVFLYCMNSQKFLSGMWRTQNSPVWPVDLAIKLWNPTKYGVDNFEDLDFKNIDDFRAQGGMSMTYGIKRGFSILKSHEETLNHNYKYIIRWRYDLLLHCSDDRNKRNLLSNNRYLDETIPLFGRFKEPFESKSIAFWEENNNHKPDNSQLHSIDEKIDWEYLKSKMDEGNTIFVMPGWNWNSDKGCCDLFLVGSRDAMEKYSLYHDKFMDLYSRPDCHSNEDILGIYLKDVCGIRVLNYYFGDIGMYR